MQTYPTRIVDMQPRLLGDLLDRLRNDPSAITAREKRMLADFVEQTQLPARAGRKELQCEL